MDRFAPFGLRPTLAVVFRAHEVDAIDLPVLSALARKLEPAVVVTAQDDETQQQRAVSEDPKGGLRSSSGPSITICGADQVWPPSADRTRSSRPPLPTCAPPPRRTARISPLSRRMATGKYPSPSTTVTVSGVAGGGACSGAGVQATASSKAATANQSHRIAVISLVPIIVVASVVASTNPPLSPGFSTLQTVAALLWPSWCSLSGGRPSRADSTPLSMWSPGPLPVRTR